MRATQLSPKQLNELLGWFNGGGVEDDRVWGVIVKLLDLKYPTTDTSNFGFTQSIPINVKGKTLSVLVEWSPQSPSKRGVASLITSIKEVGR